MALDQAGVQFIAQGANQYISDVNNAARATTTMGSNISKAAGQANSSTGLFSKLSGAIGGVAKIAAGFVVGQAVYALPRYLSEAVDKAKESEAATVRLNQAIKNLGGDVEKNVAVYDKAIKQGKDYAFAAGDQKSALAILTAQTSSARDTLYRYNLAMDLSRGANIDLVTASRLLGKVTDENVNVLARYGIKVEKGADDTRLFGAIQEKFGGQAKAFAESNAGLAERVSISFGALKTRIGKDLLPIMLALSQFSLNVLTPALGGVITMVERFGSSFFKVLGKLLGGGFQFNFFGELRAEFDGLIGFLSGKQTALEWNTSIIGRFMFHLRDDLLPVLKDVANFAIAVGRALATRFVSDATTAVNFVKDDAIPWFTNLAKTIDEKLGGALSRSEKTVEGYVTKINHHFSLFGKDVKLPNLPELNVQNISALVQIVAALTVLPALLGGVGAVLLTIFSPLSLTVIALAGAFLLIKGHIGDIGRLATDTFRDVKGAIGGAITEAGNLWHYFTLGLEGGSIGGKSATQTTLFNIGAYLRDDVIPALADAGNAANNFINGLLKGASGAQIGGEQPGAKQTGFDIGAAFRGVIPDVKAALDEVAGLVSGVFAFIKVQLVDLAGAPWGKAFENLVTAAQFTAEFLIEAFKTIYPVVKPFADLIATVFIESLKSINKIIQIFVDLIAGDWSAAWRDFKSLLNSALTVIIAIPKAVLDAMIAGAPLLLKGGEWIATQIINGVIGYHKWVIEEGGKLVGVLLDAIGSLADNVVKGGEWIANQIIKGVSNLFGSLYKLGSDLLGALVGGMVNIANEGVKLGAKFLEGVVHGITNPGNTLGAIGKLASKIVQETAESLGERSPSTYGIAIGENFGSAIATGMQNSIGDISGVVSDYQLEMLGIYRGWPANSTQAKAAGAGGPLGPLGGYYDYNKIWVPLVDNAQQAAKDMVKGLNSNLSDGVPSFIQTATSAGNAIGSGISDGIQSGLSSVPGILTGLTDQVTATVQQMATIINGGVKAVTGPNGFAGYATSSQQFDSNGVPTIGGMPIVSGTSGGGGNPSHAPPPIPGKTWLYSSQFGWNAYTDPGTLNNMTYRADLGGYVSNNMPMRFGSGGYAPKPMPAIIGDAPGGEWVLTAQQISGLISMIPRQGTSNSWSQQSSVVIENVTLPSVMNADQFMAELNALQDRQTAMRLRLGSRGVSVRP